MSSLFIFIVFLCLVGLLIMWRITSNLELLKANRHGRLVKHTEYITQLQRLYEKTPKSCISREVKLLIINDILNSLEQCKKIEPNNKMLDDSIESYRNQKIEAKNHSETTQVNDTKDQSEAREIRRRLMNLHKYLVKSKKARKLPARVASEEIRNIRHLFVEAGTHAFINQAKEADKQNKHRLAIHYFGRAISEYQKANNPTRYVKKIDSLKEKIKQIKSEFQDVGVIDPGGANELTKGMNKMLAMEKSTDKKKY